MMHVTYPINNLPRALPLCLGVQSEYGARPISIDVSAWVGRWPDIVVSIQPVRPGEEESYPAAGVTREGNVVTWTPNAYDTDIPGTGHVEVVGLADGVKIIRAGASTTIAPTRTSVSKEPGEPIAAWADTVIKAGEQAKADANRAQIAADQAGMHAAVARQSENAAKGSEAVATEQAALAETARVAAERDAGAAEHYAQEAVRARGDAQMLAREAQKAQTAAEAAATMAESSASTAQDAKNAVETAAEQAKKSASEANTHKTQAIAASNAATMAASAAAKSETAAREAAVSVAGGVEAANTAAQNAAKSAQAAASSADGVKDAEKAAEASAILAEEKATQAQGAAASAEQAKSQAVSAADKATAAQTAAEKARSEASDAAAKAATAQAAAAADAKTASSAATTASAAAQDAGNSATNASDSAQAAQSSAEAAADAQATAEAAATRAEVVRNSIPEEYTALSEAVRLKAPAIICEASGDIVTINDAAEGQALSLVSHIEPVQEGSGDPSVRDISGWDSIELICNGSENVLTGEILRCGLATSSDGESYLAPGSNYSSLYASVKPGRYYTVSRASTNDGVRFGVGASKAKYSGTRMEMEPLTQNFSNSAATNLTVKIPDGYTHMYVYVDNTSATIDITKFWATEGQTSLSAYEPPNYQAISATSPETVYGGKYEWEMGRLTVTHGYIGSYAGEDVPDGWISSTGGLDAGAQVVYPLETPYTIQLTPQRLALLKGTNNVWSSTGKTDLQYIADTKLYIDNALSAIAASVINA